MLFYAIGSFAITLFNFFLFTLIYRRQHVTPTIKAYFQWSFFVAFWSLGYGITLSGWFDYEPTLIWNKFCQSMAILIGPFFFKLTSILIGKYSKYRKIFLVYFSIATIIAVLLFFTDFFVKGLWSFGEFRYQPLGGPLYIIFILAFFLFNVHGYYLIWTKFKSSSGLQHKRLKMFLISTGIGYGLSGSLFLQGLKWSVPPFGIFFMFSYVIILGYAIHKYKFLDIPVLVRKTLVFAGLFSFILACFSIPLIILPKIITQSVTEQIQWWLIIVAGIAVASLVGPLNTFLVNITDRFLFQKREEMKVILKNLSEKVVAILDLERVGQTILSSLVGTFRLESGMIVVRDRKSKKFRLLESVGLLPEEFAHSVKQYFDEFNLYEQFQKLQPIVSLDNPDSDELPNNVLEWLRAAKARVYISLIIDEDQNGFLILGKKKSDQDFTKEETDYFPMISSQVSLVIQKARLIETVVEEREAKVKAEHLAKRVEFAGLIKHEIKNKLVHIQMPANATSTYCVPRLKKLFKEQDEELFLETCDEIAEGSKKINFATDQILIIAQTASGGVDENDKSVQELTCKVIWDDAKRESGLLEKCDFESKMPDGFSVYGNYHNLQRVFVNLITNAYDAMKDKEEPLIKLRCSYENIEEKRVAYFELEDSGCGIPREIQGKIFEDGFSTKPKPDAKDLISSGYGQGLAACKMYIESIHHGKIWVESEVGKGAIFKFWVPMKEENGNGAPPERVGSKA